MSRTIFEIEKYLLEQEIKKYSAFLDSNLKQYEVIEPNLDEMTSFAEKVKSGLTQDIGKSLEEFFKYMIVPDWKVMFDADNFIDTGKTLDEQREILADLISSLKVDGKFLRPFMSIEMTEILNTKFLNQDYKYHVLLSILEAEHRLCNSEIFWKDALLDRIRIMFYSALFIADVDKVEDTIEMINKKTFKSVIPKDIIALLKEFSITDAFSEKVTLFDVLHYLTFIAIGCGPSDDYMDLDEDLENNKVTGVTQCIKQGINVKHVLSTTLEYLKQETVENHVTTVAKKWFIDLMSLMYVDLKKCFDYCKSVTPYGYKIIFQRKG